MTNASRGHLAAWTLAALLSLTACGNTPPTPVGVEPPPAPKVTAADAPALQTAPATPSATVAARGPERTFVAPDPIPFEASVERAGSQLLDDAQAQVGDEARTVVIDPLIDANTGAQTVSTVRMGEKLQALLKQGHPGWTLKPLTRATLESRPLLLIGTLTPVTVERSIDKQPDAFRVWLTMIDLRTQRVVAKQLDRATVNSVDPEPLRYFRDSPSWHRDKTVAGYINSCQVNTKIGDAADADYLQRLPGAAILNEAMLAYNDGKLPEANKLYKEARNLTEPGDLRLLNGLYLTSWQLGHRDEAKEAFSQLVDSGLEAKRLPVKLLFKPGTVQFNDIGDLGTQYQMWLGAIADEAGKAPVCVRVTGHTSRTGSASANERLSLRRAEAVAQTLTTRNRSLGARLKVAGAGSREALVGLGTDDQRDALDRRVEFKVVDCV